MVQMVYTDRPGIVAIYGKAFAEAGINIASHADRSRAKRWQGPVGHHR
jgi:glycine cleavage system regulatory protein